MREILYNKKSRSALDSNEKPNDMLDADGQVADDARAVRKDEEEKDLERKTRTSTNLCTSCEDPIVLKFF